MDTFCKAHNHLADIEFYLGTVLNLNIFRPIKGKIGGKFWVLLFKLFCPLIKVFSRKSVWTYFSSQKTRRAKKYLFKVCLNKLLVVAHKCHGINHNCHCIHFLLGSCTARCVRTIEKGAKKNASSIWGWTNKECTRYPHKWGWEWGSLVYSCILNVWNLTIFYM